MKYNYKLEYFEKSADYVKSKIDFQPQIAIILGTALGKLAEDIVNPVEIPYEEIPNFLIDRISQVLHLPEGEEVAGCQRRGI